MCTFITLIAATEDENAINTGNGEAGAKEAGKFRMEGKTYEVKDGDVLHFLFNA